MDSSQVPGREQESGMVQEPRGRDQRGCLSLGACEWKGTGAWNERDMIMARGRDQGQ